MAEHTDRSYLPAAGHDWLLPVYDPVVRLLGGDAARRALIEQAELESGHRVLEIGCGTGTLTVMIKHGYPGVEVAGIDPDPRALERARRKAARDSALIRFDQGFADDLPYPERSFDRVFSSFMYHHLPSDEKPKMLQEARRVLKPGGELHMVDFEGSEDGRQGFLARLFHSNERLQENSPVRVLAIMRQAGFHDADKLGRRRLLFGTIEYYRASA
jgi:ubiquinone/menaquinone biosynthesis C-methylase UbiE